ncbi:scyllo-inositol 2-dehydrogenase (NADP(+)) IolW [Vibrio stylophorae]|uniref:Scyllo-inositol 2-dehydrogenase (NADP(+)) IolW n=1 Tax=Vibrio stylophorae TaxID=659351 RepID=A0ABN8DSE4_9VIBR|nr:oxidoreductase [Vibrio stylophorae]CAH0532753.1 scyllo-inositol 2-dehydrogenase (NADP(+)) IolW [Vibrio stylophorae]
MSTAIAPSTAASEQSTRPIRTALVGFGISGQCFQAPIIDYVTALDLVAVVSSDAEKVHQQLPQVTVYPNLNDLLTDDSIELVIIATPNNLHYPMAKQALDAGKHVVIEKPFVNHSEDGKALIALAKAHHRKLTVYHSRRFDGDFLTIKRLMNEQTFGQVHTFYSSYNRYRPEVKVRWREQNIPGAGILYDLGAHLIDQALALFGLPILINATLRNQRPGAQAVDHFHVQLHYPDCDVILHGNCLSTTEGPRFQVFGDQASFIKYGMDSQEAQLREKQGPEHPGWGLDDPANFGVLTTAEGERRTIPTEQGGYEQFFTQLATAIHHNHPLPVLPDEALNVVRVIEAAYQSAAEKRTIPFLPA